MRLALLITLVAAAGGVGLLAGWAAWGRESQDELYEDERLARAYGEVMAEERPGAKVEEVEPLSRQRWRVRLRDTDGDLVCVIVDLRRFDRGDDDKGNYEGIIGGLDCPD